MGILIRSSKSPQFIRAASGECAIKTLINTYSIVRAFKEKIAVIIIAHIVTTRNSLRAGGGGGGGERRATFVLFLRPSVSLTDDRKS